jgi:hypothetical protein
LPLAAFFEREGQQVGVTDIAKART